MVEACRGRRSPADTPAAQTYDADGNPYVWIRTADGDVTRAYQRGSV